MLGLGGRTMGGAAPTRTVIGVAAVVKVSTKVSLGASEARIIGTAPPTLVTARRRVSLPIEISITGRSPDGAAP